MDKYKNKDGIELSYTNDNDIHQQLVKEVIGEAIKILSTFNMHDKVSRAWAIHKCKEFLTVNFNIEED